MEIIYILYFTKFAFGDLQYFWLMEMSNKTNFKKACHVAWYAG